MGDTAVFSTTFHVIREYTSLTRNLEARAAQSAGQMARYKDKRKMVRERLRGSGGVRKEREREQERGSLVGLGGRSEGRGGGRGKAWHSSKALTQLKKPWT